MSQAVSNLSLSLPLTSKTSIKPPRIVDLFTPNYGSFTYNTKPIKAQASGEPRDNLDHLQRAAKQPHQTQQNKKRVTPVAPIGLWDRFPTARTVQHMMETMEMMMEDPFVYSGTRSSPLPRETGGYNSKGRTPWEIKEGENEYNMRFDMPGMTKEDVKVWVEEKMLVVKAEKVAKKKENGHENNYDVVDDEDWSAKSFGRYSSRIALPENVQFEKITAEVKDGVLYITIPKASDSGRIFDINVH